MSFYGQVLYEFTKIFNQIFVKNDGYGNQAVFMDLDNADVKNKPRRFMADEKWDSITFNTGNRWVNLDYNNSADGNVITFSHATPGTRVRSTVGFFGREFTEEETANNTLPGVTAPQGEPIKLQPGQVFLTSEATFDNAGHLTGAPAVKRYQLPPSKIQLDSETDTPIITSSPVDSLLHFEDDKNWIQFTKATSNVEGQNYDVLKCGHKTLHNDALTVPGMVKQTTTPASSVALTEGDYFSISNFGVDKAGHVSSTGTNYFRMPYYNYNLPDNAYGFKKTHDNGTNINSINGGNVTVLGTGDFFSTDTFTLNDNGRVTGITTNYYKLPYTNFEADLTTVQNDIANLKSGKVDTTTFNAVANRVSAVESGKVDTATFNAVANRVSAVESGKVNTETFNAVANRVSALETVTGTTIPATYAPLSMTGNVSSIYVDPKTSTLASTIGQVDGDNGYSKNIARLLSEDTTNVYTISDSLSTLAEKTLENEASTLGVSARVTLLINRLKELGINLGDSIK